MIPLVITLSCSLVNQQKGHVGNEDGVSIISNFTHIVNHAYLLILNTLTDRLSIESFSRKSQEIPLNYKTTKLRT